MERNDNLDWRGKPRVQTTDFGPSMTDQSERDLADIRKVLARFKAGGLQTMLDEAQLVFADVSEFTDLADAMRQAKVAEEEFLKLPSKVREIFNHDVAEWLDHAHDEDKREKLVQAGFLKAPEAPMPSRFETALPEVEQDMRIPRNAEPPVGGDE